MNAPVLLAQLQGNSTPTGSAPRHIKLEKPEGGATVTVYLNGPIQLDFADIASEKLTFVRVGDKLIVLFDNQSTVTLEPVFGPDGHPLGNLSFEMAPDHMLTGDQFASQFPITTDQSILPAAGAGGGPTAGAHFSDPSVDPLSVGNPLALLGAENNGSTFAPSRETPANTAPTSTPDCAGRSQRGRSAGRQPGRTRRCRNARHHLHRFAQHQFRHRAGRAQRCIRGRPAWPRRLVLRWRGRSFRRHHRAWRADPDRLCRQRSEHRRQRSIHGLARRHRDGERRVHGDAVAAAG